MNVYSIIRRVGQTILAGCLFASGFAVAQSDYPNRTIRLVAPLAPGGAVDILSRIVAERLGAAYGQSVIVENRLGASGHVGAQQVAKSPGDGYTLVTGTIGIHAAFSAYRKLNYDPSTELQPVTILGESPNIVVVPANSPFKTFAEFMAFAKANPGKLNYGSAGPGSSIHMVTALFEQQAGAPMKHIAYKGSGPALIDLMSGTLDVMFENLSSGLPHVQAGKLRVLAITGPKRDPKLPNVPTVDEAGLPGYSAQSWFTIAAPASVPAPLIEKISNDVRRVLRTPEVAARFDALGMQMVANTPAEAQAFFKSETAKWSRVIQGAGMQLD